MTADTVKKRTGPGTALAGPLSWALPHTPIDTGQRRRQRVPQGADQADLAVQTDAKLLHLITYVACLACRGVLFRVFKR